MTEVPFEAPNPNSPHLRPFAPQIVGQSPPPQAAPDAAKSSGGPKGTDKDRFIFEAAVKIREMKQLLTETQGDWRAMPLPAWESGGARSGAMGGSSFAIPKDGENSELAALFYSFLMFDESGYSAVWGPSSVYPSGLNTSIPSYLPAADPSAPLFEPVPALGDQDLWAVATEAGAEIPASVPTPSWWAGAVDYLGTNMQRMLDGELTPSEVLEQSSTEIQTNLIDRQ